MIDYFHDVGVIDFLQSFDFAEKAAASIILLEPLERQFRRVGIEDIPHPEHGTLSASAEIVQAFVASPIDLSHRNDHIRVDRLRNVAARPRVLIAAIVGAYANSVGRSR